MATAEASQPGLPRQDRPEIGRAERSDQMSVEVHVPRLLLRSGRRGALGAITSREGNQRSVRVGLPDDLHQTTARPQRLTGFADDPREWNKLGKLGFQAVPGNDDDRWIAGGVPLGDPKRLLSRGGEYQDGRQAHQ